MAALAWGVIFACLGLVVLGYMAYALVGSFLKSGPGLIDRWRIRSKHSELKQGAVLLENAPNKEQMASALRHLEQSFCLEYLFQHPQILDQLDELHEAVLERVIHSAEKLGVHLNALPELEDLLKAHTALLREYAETQASRNEIKKRRTQKGKETPEWALSEFEKKISLLGSRIVKNQKDAAEVIRVVFRSLREPQRRAEQVYH